MSLAIERLEGMQSSAVRNYDYVVLQATTNSVQFYESMGFVRVGALTANENFNKKQRGKQTKNSSKSKNEESSSESKEEVGDTNTYSYESY